MTEHEKETKQPFPHLDLPKIASGKPIADAVAMTVEFVKLQGEVAYEIAKKQAIATTSTASTIGIGWSAFFFGILEQSWLTSSLGLMLVFGGTYLLAYWTPRVLDRLRTRLDEKGTARFYAKWLPELAGPEGANESP